MDNLKVKVQALEAITTDMSLLIKSTTIRLEQNESRTLSLVKKAEDSSIRILSAIAKLNKNQDVHMARSDEKFIGVGSSLSRVIDKLDATAERLSAVEPGRSNSEASPESPQFIDSPNFKWIMAPIIIVLLGLFGMAGYNVTKDAKILLDVAEVQSGD